MLFGLGHFFITMFLSPNALSQTHSCRHLFNPINIEYGLNLSDIRPIDFKTYAEIKNYENTVFKPQRGYLRGFEITVPKEIKAKLELKHNLRLKDVEEAFNSWSLGPVRLETLDHNSRYNDKIRYYFVSQVKKRIFKNGRFHQQVSYIKVILDMMYDDSLILVSSYPSNKSAFDSYLEQRKEL